MKKWQTSRDDDDDIVLRMLAVGAIVLQYHTYLTSNRHFTISPLPHPHAACHYSPFRVNTANPETVPLPPRPSTN